jgi:hypothetical protein
MLRRPPGPSWQGRQESNLRHPVLETGALASELHPFARTAWQDQHFRTTAFRFPVPAAASNRERVHSIPVSPPAGGQRTQSIDGQFYVSFTDRSEAPIYAGLVDEHGDVLAEVRRVAEQTLREVERALDFSDVRVPATYR